MIYQWFTGEYDSDAVVVVLIENQTVKHLIVPDCTIVDSYFGREQVPFTCLCRKIRLAGRYTVLALSLISCSRSCNCLCCLCFILSLRRRFCVNNCLPLEVSFVESSCCVLLSSGCSWLPCCVNGSWLWNLAAVAAAAAAMARYQRQQNQTV